MGSDTDTSPSAAIARAEARLAELDGLPVDRHAAVYTEVHEALQAALTAVDEE